MVYAMATLSVQECRKYLVGLDLTDKQVEQIRDNLVSIINTLLDKLIKNGK